MKRSPGSIAVLIGLSAAELMLSARRASAHEAFVTLRGPHASLAIGIAAPVYRPGMILPRRHRVSYRRHLGHGFHAPVAYCAVHRVRHAHWVPVRRHRTGWIVVSAPYRPVAPHRRYQAYR